MPNSPTPQIIFASGDNPITPDKAIIHSDETFAVQWSAFNAGQQESPEFTDQLVVSSIPEGCPGSDDQEHPVVFDSEQDGTSSDFAEAPIPAGQQGPLMHPTVGPFPTGSYRLTVTLAKGVANTPPTFNCIDIIDPI